MAPTSIPKDESHVTKFIVVSTVLYTIALIMFMSRMWIRNHKTHFHPAKVRIEDWALVVAMVRLSAHLSHYLEDSVINKYHLRHSVLCCME